MHSHFRHTRALVGLLILQLAAALASFTATAHAFAPLNGSPVWPDGTIVMHLQLGTGPVLSDGKTWNSSAADMLAEWNKHMVRAKFTWITASSAPIGDGNANNNVLFSSDIFGRSFGDTTLAVTTIWRVGTRRVEGDVVFNTKYQWDSYSGPLRRSGTNQAEFSRVALHEFGHVLGLGHPDEAGQFVPAVMSSRANDLDSLTTDDRDGASFLYASNDGATAPRITVPLFDQFPVDGDAVDFSVSASGTAPFTYQWRRNGVIQGVSTASWTLSNVAPVSSGQWSVTVTNGRGIATSTMNLVVTARPVLPAITRQPAAVAARAGQNVTFTVTATGSTPRYHQWRKNGVNLGFATTSDTYTITEAQPTDAGSYSVIVSNAGGNLTSADAALTFVVPSVPAAIVAQPSPYLAALGFNAVFSASVAGTFPLTYQWWRNGTALTLPRATGTLTDESSSPSLTIPAATAVDAGLYTLTVTNAFGTATSLPAQLFVAPVSTAGHLTNLAIRSVAGTAADTLIVGFTLAGGRGTYQRLLLRAVGPGLAAFGVPGTLPDPRLDLYREATLAVSNEDWAGNSSVAEYGTRVGAFDLPSATSKDAALVHSLNAGNYSAQVTGATTGVALAEIYDVADAYTDISPRFSNLSARTRVGTGGDILIAGFALAGTTPKTVLIRAVGPSLAAFGLIGTLADPILEIYGNGNTKIAENNDWAGTADLTAASAAVGAFALPASSKDAALRITLPAGADSAQVRGANGTTGIALVEIYEVP